MRMAKILLVCVVANCTLRTGKSEYSALSANSMKLAVVLKKMAFSICDYHGTVIKFKFNTTHGCAILLKINKNMRLY